MAMYCNKCGRKVSEADFYCPGCGNRLVRTASPTREQQELYTAPLTVKKQEKNPMPILAIGAVVLILALLLVPRMTDRPADSGPELPGGPAIEMETKAPEETAPPASAEVPETVPEPLRIVAVDGGLDHTVVLYSDGTVRCAGGNDFGQCDTESWTDIVQISTMKYHTVGLRRDGTVVATGMSNSGQCDVGDWTDIVAVSTGVHHTVGVRSDGTVVFAGESIMGEDDIAHWRNVKTVACMYTNTVGLCKDGTVYIAGSMASGKVSGWENIKAIRASDSHLLLLRSDGAILTSGNN